MQNLKTFHAIGAFSAAGLWPVNCNATSMNNTRIGVLIGSGVATGIALMYTARRRRNRSILARTSRQAVVLKHRASKLRDSAANFLEKSRSQAGKQKKGFMQAVEAGKAAYQRVAG
jgi:hypothetical protein